MEYTRDELSQFTLQKLASIYPQDLAQETLLKEVFQQRAAVSNYFTLTSLVDIKSGWQEEIIQKFVDQRRETMALENPAVLSEEDEAALDTNVITKEKELELQAKLDKKNGRYKEVPADEDASIEPEETVLEELPVEAVSEKKVKAKKK